MKQTIPADDLSAFYLPKLKALVTETQSVPRTTSALVNSQDSDPMAYWGDNNDFPQLVIKDVRQDAELPNLLDEKARLLYSGGLVWGKLEKGPDGSEKLLALDTGKEKEIEEWMMRSNINRYVLEAAKDLYWFGNAFPEVVRTVDGSKIIQLCVQAAETCRWEKQDNAGIVRNCYINANFPDAKATDRNTKKLPVLDPYYDPASTLRVTKGGTNFIYPLSIPTPGSSYYQLADWNSIRASGWLAVSAAVPKFKSAMLGKQMTIKYLIEVSQLYWEYKFEGFSSKSAEEKAALKKEEFDNFQLLLSGTEQSGGNLITPFITDPATGKELSLWKVTALDDKIKDGKYLEDGKDASLYKYSAMGIHPALLGTMPNNGLGGAGSNIREAYTLYIMKIRAHQDIILEPLNSLVKYYNGWEEVSFRFRNSFMNTLDKGSETTKTVA